MFLSEFQEIYCFVFDCFFAAEFKDKDEFVEGDIELNDVVKKIMAGNMPQAEREALAKSLKWPETAAPDGQYYVPIPFEISNSLGRKAKNAIQQAIKDFTEFTCIRFTPRLKNEKDYVKFVDGRG